MKIVNTELHHAEYELKIDWEITGNIVICPTFTITAKTEENGELYDVIFQNGTYDSAPHEKAYLEPSAESFPIKLTNFDFEELEDEIPLFEELASKLLKEKFRDELLQLEMLNAALSDTQKRKVLKFSDRRSIANLVQTIKIMKDELDD